jgi:hypothetical protein
MPPKRFGVPQQALQHRPGRLPPPRPQRLDQPPRVKRSPLAVHRLGEGDAYTDYDRFFATGQVVEVGCWAHARRKFFEAQATEPVRTSGIKATTSPFFSLIANFCRPVVGAASRFAVA